MEPDKLIERERERDRDVRRRPRRLQFAWAWMRFYEASYFTIESELQAKKRMYGGDCSEVSTKVDGSDFRAMFVFTRH